MACSTKLKRGSEDTRAAAAIPHRVAKNVICASKNGRSMEELCFPSLVLYFSDWKNGNKHTKYAEQDYFFFLHEFFTKKKLLKIT